MAKSKAQRPRAERRSRTGLERGPAVSDEDRRKLATCCAFFKAKQYREAGPEDLRESDIDIAEASISEVVETSCAPSAGSRRKRH